MPSNGYDGSLSSMYCADLVVTATGSVTDVVLEVAMEHTWVGDVTVKVVAPNVAEYATVLSRPGLAETVDDGSGCCGAGANVSYAYPLTFDENESASSENMGDQLLSGDTICQDDSLCSFAPSSGAAGYTLSHFAGSDMTGTWQVCMGDSAFEDDGQLYSARLNINGGCP